MSDCSGQRGVSGTDGRSERRFGFGRTERREPAGHERDLSDEAPLRGDQVAHLQDESSGIKAVVAPVARGLLSGP